MTDNMRNEKNVYYTIMKKRGGLLPCWHGQRNKGSQRSCVHDAFLNDCDQFKIYVNKKILYSELPIHQEVNEQIEKVRECSSIRNTKLLFQNVVIRNLRGPQIFLRRQKDRLFICLATVEATDGSNDEDH